MKKLLATTLIAIFSLLIPAQLASAASFDPFGTVCGPSTKGSAVCTDHTTNVTKYGNPIANEIIAATRIIAIVAGVAAIILIIVSAIRFITANGDSNSISSARNSIIYAFIGLVVIVIAQSLIVFVVSKLP